MLERIFKLKENKTKVSTEFLAGLTTFIAMSYIIFLNPAVLSKTGMDYNSVYAATIITSIISTLILGLFANVPYAQSAGIGLGSLFTYTICGTLGYTWQQALAMVFICGSINVLITFTSIRKKIIKAIPKYMQEAITVGIGLYIAYIGFIDSNLVSIEGSVPTLGFLSNPTAMLSIIGLIITSILVVKKVKGSYLIGITLTTLIGIPLGVTPLPDFSNYTILPSIKPTFLQLDFVGLFSAKTGILVLIMTIFTFCLSDLFDTIGIFIGTGKKSGIFKIDHEGNMPPNLERAMFADSLGTIVGAIFGTSNITTYLESSAGISVGGRTGLTSVFVAIFFLLSLFLYPIISCVPMAAIAPVLIILGATMLENVGDIEWNDYLVCIPAFFIIIMMPITYSITTGIQFGFIFYTLLNIISGKAKEIPLIIYIFTVIFIFSLAGVI